MNGKIGAHLNDVPWRRPLDIHRAVGPEVGAIAFGAKLLNGKGSGRHGRQLSTKPRLVEGACRL